MLRTLILLCLLFIPLLPIVSQEVSNDDGWYYGKEITKIDFEGLKNITSVELDGIVDPYVGKKFSDDQYNDLLNKLFGLEYFQNINTKLLKGDSEGNTVIIQFTVTEQPIISLIRYRGNDEVRSSELSDEITIKQSDIYNSNSVGLAQRKISKLYLTKGYTNVSVTYDTEETEDGIEITFNIKEGKKSVITEINFQGNEAITEKTLRKNLKLKTVSLFNKGAFEVSALNQDKTTILNEYYNRGYINAQIIDVIKDVSYNEDKKRDEILLTFVISEGETYTYGGTKITGNTIFTTDELLSLIKISDGDAFNQSLFKQGLSDIADKYYEEGYTSNLFDQNIKEDSVTHVVSCVLNITENAQSYIENIIIRGNDKTKDYVIRREIPLEEGDIFSKSKVETGLRSLYNLQFFSSIVPDIVPGSEENTVDLIIDVEEQSTTSIEFGITFSGVSDSDDLPISLFATWKDSNVKGTGKAISTSVTVSDDTQSLELGYSDSWFLDKTIDFSTSLSVSREYSTDEQVMYFPDGVNDDDYYFDYEEYTFGLDIGLGKRWVYRPGTVTVSGGLSSDCSQNFYDADLYEPVDSDISDDYGDWGLQNSLWNKVSFDARDLSYDPSKGYFTSEQLTYTGLIPSIENDFYFKNDLKGEVYLTLFDKPITDAFSLKFVLAGYSGLSLLFPVNGDTISEDNQLYIDGMFYGRGWDLGDDDDYYGNAMWANNIELRMPIVTGIFALDFFGDAVLLKDTYSELFTESTLEDWKFSFGPGIRFSIPQFPLRLLLANTFRYEDGEVVWDDGKDISDGPQWNFVLSFTITNK
ncbi:MAG: outer membrane protein assembly factor BamA [Treponema sp. CETP13]|nr:MAG: outer membrane protein assembly factor BamA [Treponema sp. CETP13]